MTPYKVKFEIEIDENQECSINIGRADEISQYIENLHELLPDTYPNVNLNSNDNLHKLKSDNRTELLTVFEALLEAIFNVEIQS
ncbi:MAG: hypothetical protein ACFFB0_21495 [Promethearchaeota archaeon]